MELAARTRRRGARHQCGPRDRRHARTRLGVLFLRLQGADRPTSGAPRRGLRQTARFLGPLRSIDAKRKRDASLDIEYGYFAERAELRQRVRVPADGNLATTLRGQACHEADGTCHLIRQEISIAGTH